MTTKTFATDYLKNELDLPYMFEDTVFIEEHRWYDLRLGVFTDDTITYGVEYCDPKTEMQEDLDPFYDQTEVTAHEVVKIPVTTYVWKVI